jgi:ribosomal protein S18 acetylase RimI-like enzyme
MKSISAGLIVRRALETDISSLLAIEGRSFPSDRLNRRSFRHLIARANCDCLVATQDDAIVACAIMLYRRGAQVARLHSLAVEPVLRGAGIGTLLLQAAEDAARRHGAKTLRLAVRTDNKSATMLYQSRGYKELGTVDAYYGDGMSAYSMEKALAAAR